MILITDIPPALLSLSPVQWIGVVGFAIYMAGFLLVQTGHLDGNGVLFPASKVVAALCVLCSLVDAFNLATLLIQLSFVVIGSYGVIKRLLWKRSARRATPRPMPDHSAASA